MGSSINFSNSGGKNLKLKSIAGTNQLLAIILDGESIRKPVLVINLLHGITGGSATISGNFNAENARELEVQLKGVHCHCQLK